MPVEYDEQERSLRLSDASGVTLLLGEGEHLHDGLHFVDFPVTISADGLVAKSLVRSSEGPSPQGLRRFFRELAADWKGTRGDRTWESIEHDLTIKASRDALGHVLLAFTLREKVLPDAWEATVIVCLEAGEEMQRAAAGVERLLSAE